MFRCALPLSLACLLTFDIPLSAALPSLPNLGGQLSSLSWSPSKRSTNFDTNPNGSTFIWVEQDFYEGPTFFDRWNFYTGEDPTHGTVNFVNESIAFATGLAYVTPDNIVIMQGDNTTQLQPGQNRNSVRINSQAQYNTGLFILDLNRAPWGCSVWPAFWMVGPNWPYNGEIDIIEGVHANEHNQVTWHTAPGCALTATANFTGTVVQNNGQNNTDCDGLVSGNPGCGIVEWSRSSYGPYFDSTGGGVFAMRWDENGIAVWSFYRAAVPPDIVAGEPNTANWGVPVAFLAPETCDPIANFVNQSIVFDITFCGDWAGNSYATSGCPSTCSETLMDPTNYVNATWNINSLKVYRKQNLVGISSAARSRYNLYPTSLYLSVLLAFALLLVS